MSKQIQTSKVPCVLIAGGGTGGHVIPAIAVAREFKRLGANVRFVGTENKIEEKLVPEAGFLIDFIKVKPIAGVNPFLLPKRLLLTVSSILSSFKLLKKIKPDFVLGVGGYISGPLVLAARLKKIPGGVLEQNAICGLTNKILSKFINIAFVNYPETARCFPGSIVKITGNPVKSEICKAAEKKERISGNNKNEFQILVMGGSSGALGVDKLASEAIIGLNLDKKIKVLHQCGKNNIDNVLASYKNAKIDASVASFIDDMPQAYLNADLVICRSGATTVSEVTTMGLPAIFLPYPHHKDNQQALNAAPMKKNGSAFVFDEKLISPDDITLAIKHFFLSPKNLKEAGIASKKLAKPDAAHNIAKSIFQVIGK